MVIHPQAPILTQPGAVLAAVKDAKRRAKGAVAKRPSLTAPARAALCVVRPGRRNGPFQPNKETTLKWVALAARARKGHACHPFQTARRQIFATDVDDRAIEVARAGLYLGTIAADLSTERLERNFVKEDGNYRVAKQIREMCLFSVHDLVKDPPFSRLGLISCRNLLIYCELPLQQRILTTFHYALQPGRHLFLGPSA
jgi:hypothetical protein